MPVAVFAWLILVGLVAYPVAVCFILRKNIRCLVSSTDDSKLQDRWGLLLRDLRQEHYWYRVTSYLLSLLLAVDGALQLGYEYKLLLSIFFFIFQTCVVLLTWPFKQVHTNCLDQRGDW